MLFLHRAAKRVGMDSVRVDTGAELAYNGGAKQIGAFCFLADAAVIRSHNLGLWAKCLLQEMSHLLGSGGVWTCKRHFVMSFPFSELPTEIGVKELSFDESAEVLVAQAVQGKVAAGRQEGYDVYKSALFPGQTFQVKTARASMRPGETKELNGSMREIRDTYLWAFRVGQSDYSADWYILFGERDGLIYPFLLTQDDWDKCSSFAGGNARMLTITAQEHSRCGRYYSAYKRNRHWKYVIRKWPDGLLAKLRSPRVQLRLAI